MFSKAPRLQRGAEAILGTDVSSLTKPVHDGSKYLPELSKSGRKGRNSKVWRRRRELTAIGENEGVVQVIKKDLGSRETDLRVNLESTAGRRRQARVSASLDETTWSASKLLRRSELLFVFLHSFRDFASQRAFVKPHFLR